MEILKVLIVDDEHLIRNLIKIKIKWDELGMKAVGEAGSAKEALEQIDKLVPDIIFTDICMPSMDGIEFSRIVFEKYPHIKIVVITGYDEFEYARSSIKLGIADFILKPINSDELMKTLAQLKEKILAERLHIKEYNKLKEQLAESLPILREKFLSELLSEDLSLEEITEKIDYFKIPINSAYNSFQVAVVELSSSIKNEQKEESKILLSIECTNAIKSFFKSDAHILVFLDNRRRIVILSNNDKIELIECCEILKGMIITRLKCFVGIGIGTRRNGLEYIKCSYKEAIDALSCTVFVGKNQVISYQDIGGMSSQSYASDRNKMEKLNVFMHAGAKESALMILDQLFNVPGCYDKEIMTKMRLEAFDIFSIGQHIISEQKLNMDEIWQHDIGINDLILKVDNLPELKGYMREFIGSITGIIEQTNNNKAYTLIEEVKDYLKANMNNPEISLSGVAKTFYISSGHLGRLFKQQTSQTFVEYLTEVRMKKAEKLLRETHLKGYQVGEEVGIRDSHYFSILFKKYTGFSINEFRKI
ncbi:response regulator [Cellulosilyticum sp. I15G10I2]|uniref:response regulator n=1 Tax=Cellulosilyticum sp. I15G10I2 TaxID=1892843 RepID=UPI00085C0967|nr:response regulator [Cellulosilyticum sp. I15G10I2]